jgi:hypothetical protein
MTSWKTTADDAGQPPRHGCGRTLSSAALRRGVVGTLLLALVAGSAPASEPGAVLDYEVRYGPLQIMAVRTTTRFDGDRYQAGTDVRTVGIVALLFPWSAASSAAGERVDGTLRPERYRATGEYRGEQRLTEIEYDASSGMRVRAEPTAEADDRDPVPPALQRATIDPLTAALAAVTDCRGTLRVFDGRRRYDLQISDLGDSDTPSARHALYSGRARHCRAAIQPLAGFWRGSSTDFQPPTQIDCWIAAPRPGFSAVPVYLELSAPRGTFSIALSAAELTSATP